MFKGNKTALKVAMVISFLMAGAALFLGICIAFDLFDVNKIYNQLMNDYLGNQLTSWRSTYKYMVVAESLFSAAINIYAGVIYLKVSKMKDMVLGVNRLLIYMGLTQILFSASFISGVIAIITGVNIGKKLTSGVKYNKPHSQMDILTQQVNYLKYLKEDGKITQQEFDERLNKLLEESVRSNTKEDK